MSADRFPYFRFFPAKFMADTRGLNANEVKVYISLICRIFESGGPVENDELVLSTYCEMRPSSFRKALAKLVALGKIRDADGMLSNDAAGEEISWRVSKSEKSARAGKKSGEKRQENQGQTATDDQRTFNQEDTDAEVENTPPLPPKGGGRKLGSRLPDDWRLPMEWGQWAVDFGLPEPVVRSEAANFADYWQSKPGAGATKLDWKKTWQTWVRRKVEELRRRAPGYAPRKSTQSAFGALQEIH